MKDQQKLLSEEQFSQVFLTYLQALDDFDAQTRNHLHQMDSIRYHVDEGLKEHAELARR